MQNKETDLPSPPIDIKPILEKLESVYLGDRMEAEEELRELQPQATELLLDFLKKESQKRQKKRRLGFNIIGVTSAIGILGGTAMTLMGHPEVWAFGGMFGFLGMTGMLFQPSKAHLGGVSALSQFDDTRAAGPLAEMLNIPDLRLRVAISRALFRLLPRIEDPEALTPQQKQALCTYLRKGKKERDTAFLSVIMQTLTRLECLEALPIIASFARFKVEPNNPNADKVIGLKNVALDCQNTLEALSERLQTNATLLRPSALSTAPNELLRPAQATHDDAPEQLLRASSNGSDTPK